jgi:hypothetical protein
MDTALCAVLWCTATPDLVFLAKAGLLVNFALGMNAVQICIVHMQMHASHTAATITRSF